MIKQQMTGASAADIMGLTPQRVSQLKKAIEKKMESSSIHKELNKILVINNDKEPIHNQLATPLAY